MKYAEVDISLLAEVNLIKFVDIQRLSGGFSFISYLKCTGYPSDTAEFRTSNSRNLFTACY